MKRSSIHGLGLALGVLALLAAACAPPPQKSSSAGDDGRADGDDEPKSEADAGGGGGGGGGGGAIAVDPARKRFTCPIDKPQKVYGWALNAPSTLDADETWTKDNVYLVFGPFHTGSHTLTIEPGTVVCLDYGPPGVEGNAEPPPGSIEISQGGAIRALGTTTEHVVLTQKNGPEQYWAGIYYASGSLASSTLQNVDFYNAGLSAGLAPISTFPDYKAPPLDLQNVVFRSLQRKGPEILTSGITPKSKIFVSEYADETSETALEGYPVLKMHPIGATTLNETNFTVGPTLPKRTRFVQWSFAGAGGIGVNTRFKKLQDGLAYAPLPSKVKVMGETGGPSSVMTLEAGVVIAMPGGAPIQFGDGMAKGDLVALGTASQPVVFTSQTENKKPGDWNAIIFVPGAFDPSVSKLDHVRFEYGGGQGPDRVYNCNDGAAGDGEIVFQTPLAGGDYEGPSITNTTFAASAGNGVRGYCNNGPTNCLSTDYTPGSLGNTFEGFTSISAQTKLGCPGL